MVMYNIFCHCVQYKYKSTLCSKSTLFLGLTSFLTVVLPLIIAYRSQGFWLKSNTYREQPEVHFQHDYILLLETDQPDKPIMCSSFPGFTEMTKDFNNCYIFKARDVDNNQDGLNDELVFELHVSVPQSLSVISTQLVLLFRYKLQKQCLLQMKSLLFIQHASSSTGTKLNIIGDLKLVQKQPLFSRGRDLRYNHHIFDRHSLSPETFDYLEVLKNYAKRNVSTRLDNSYILWTTGPSAENKFLISGNIFYPEDTVVYRPGFWQVMKWAWVQYLSLLIVFIYLFRYVKCYVFTNRLVPIMQVTPWKKHF